MFYDGQNVFLPDGEQGKVIASSNSAYHVLVTTGSLTNEILLLPPSDLTALGHIDDGLEDSLDVSASMDPMLASSTPDEIAEDIVINLMATLRTKSGMLTHSALNDSHLREGAILILTKAIQQIEE